MSPAGNARLTAFHAAPRGAVAYPHAHAYFPWRLACVSGTRPLGIALLLLSLITPFSSAQVLTGAFTVNAVGDADAKHPFLLPAQGNDIKEAMGDFEQFSKRAAWEKAFQSFNTIRDGDKKRLMADGHGFYLPLDSRLHQMLASLPPSGRDAYRVFYDAEAKKLFDEAQGTKELENLEKIVTAYLATTVGDQAADRLGDLYFQRGEMDKAAAAWQTILDYLPESSLNRVQILVKAATALARANRWEEFGRLQTEVVERHAGETVTVAGKSVAAAAHLESLAVPSQAGQPIVNATAATQLPADVHLANDVQPLWQFRFLSEAQAKEITQISHQWGYGRMPFTDMIPVVAVDSSRVYMNYVGHQAAVDLETGKLLWRNEKFNDLPTKLRSNQNVVAEQYGLVASDQALFSVARQPSQLGDYNAVFKLTSWDRQTGKSIWTTDNIGDLKTWNMASKPVISGDKVIVCASKREQANELHVLALAASDGRLLWDTLVGTNQLDQRNMHNRRSAQPTLLMAGDKVFVDSNTGAIAAIDRDNGQLKWGFAYQAEMPDNNYWYNAPIPFEINNRPLFADGLLYVKGMRSSRLCAIEVGGPKLRWQRPVPKASLLLAIDGTHLLLGGEELSRINLADQKLEWATRVPVGTTHALPLCTQNQVLQFTPRGIFVLDKKTGDRLALVRGADLESLGGAIFLTPRALITVSNLAITAYPLAAPAAASVTPSTPQQASN